MWVKILLLSFSVVLIAVSFPRSVSALLDEIYSWQAAESGTDDRIEQLENINALGISDKRGYELAKAYFDQALAAKDPDVKSQAYTQSLAAFEELLAYQPHHKAGLHNIAAIYMNQSQYEQSQLYFERLLSMMTKRDFGARVRLSYFRMCLIWSVIFADQQPAQEKFLLLRAQSVFASTQPFLYWQWSGVKKKNAANLNYIDYRLEKLTKVSPQAPEKFIEITY